MRPGIPFALILVAAAIVVAPRALADGGRLNVPIGTCGCDGACFTAEVSDLRCTLRGVEFRSHGLPAPSNPLMRGITGSNQQYPRPHAYEISIPADAERAARPTATQPGAVGIAVNGVPLFDPSTQGPIDHGTGQRPHALDEGELDVCGGHAGRGDDYHYHIAPKCLIEDLGEDRIERQRQPIGFANDGFPILALGWFDPANDIEARLDRCRGMTDSQGQYFYNVKTTAKWNILDCYAGRLRHISRDHWQARRDRTGREIVGAKVRFHIDNYRAVRDGRSVCHIMEGTLVNQRVLDGPGQMRTVRSRPGAIFYCSPKCYAEFFEPKPDPKYRGPIVFYDVITEACPSFFDPSQLALFNPYVGPPLARKHAGASGGGSGNRPPRPGDGPPPPRRGAGPPPPRPGG